MEVMNYLLDYLGVFLLVFARILGIFVTAPIFNYNNIPLYGKMGFSLFLAVILVPMVNIPEALELSHFYIMLFISAKELMTGMMIGFICYLFLSSVYLAGHIIDMEIGFSIASVINPQDDTEIPIMANVLYFMATLMLLITNGHHTLIRGLVQSFNMIPLNGLNMNIFMIDKIISILITTFIISFKIAAPILAAIFITNVLLGILARTMPQMNVFVVGMPLKISVGLIVMVMIIPLYAGFFEYVFDSMFENLKDFLSLINRG
ncbi:flagellar biosynthetic protein FliR [Geosporobacter ferrireducens]|uniref:Flagellar biosynthetic protein FliR n=2 Tax=Geosporobacter ferrireducens TaxID=1424294 RepID=A0A1D8GBI0_9FIRM|nr:flagellar biosynthetic protein FliR [Geosporobacter ferrireducens]MTI57313.1 flagellar type III secretion system protein FliR [Geosporobacter ferrireducens]